MNGYQLTDEVRTHWLPILTTFLEKVEANDQEVENPDVLELSDTTLNPYTTWKLLEELGYHQEKFDDNGWQLDFWISMDKPGYKRLIIGGTGITFEFKLYADDARGNVD